MLFKFKWGLGVTRPGGLHPYQYVIGNQVGGKFYCTQGVGDPKMLGIIKRPGLDINYFKATFNEASPEEPGRYY